MSPVAKGDARAVADLSSGLILASVDIGAPPERVFAAITSAEVAEWWGSAQTYRVTKWSADLRAGGTWRCEGVSADGRAFAVFGDVLQVEPPHVFVQTWQYAGQPGAPTTLRYRIDAIPGGSRVTVRHDGFTDAASCESHAEGWERVFGWLSAWILRGRTNRDQDS